MKKYKLPLYSLGCSTLSIAAYFVLPVPFITLKIFPCLLLTILALLFSTQSVRIKHSEWLGYAVFLLATATFAFQLPAYFLLFVFGR